MKRVAMVGAGITGLGAAYELAKAGLSVSLYEKEEMHGGHARTVTIDDIDLDLPFAVFNRDEVIVSYALLIEIIVAVFVASENPLSRWGNIVGPHFPRKRYFSMVGFFSRLPDGETPRKFIDFLVFSLFAILPGIFLNFFVCWVFRCMLS